MVNYIAIIVYCLNRATVEFLKCAVNRQHNVLWLILFGLIETA